MEKQLKTDFDKVIKNIKSSKKDIELRKKNLNQFIENGFPNKRIEDWKFSDLNQIISSNIKELKFFQEAILIWNWRTCSRVLQRPFIFWQVLKQVMRNLQTILSAPCKACLKPIIQEMDGLIWCLHLHNTFLL